MGLQNLFAHYQQYSDDQILNYCSLIDEAQAVFQAVASEMLTVPPSPKNAATILAEWRVDWNIIETTIWGLTILDKNEGIEYLSTKLNPAQAQEALKLSRLNSLLREERRQSTEYAQLTKILMGKLWSDDLILMVIASFLANLVQADEVSPAERTALADQARNVFKPVISMRIGSWMIRRQMLDLACRCDDRDRYLQAEAALNAQRPRIAAFITDMDFRVKQAAQNFGLSNYRLLPDVALPYRIVNLQDRNHYQPLETRDLVSFVIVCESESLCFQFIEVLGSLGNPGRTIRNFMQHENPKGFPHYRGIHLNVKVRGGRPIRFFLRTQEGQDIAQLGILAQSEAVKSHNYGSNYGPAEEHIFVYTIGGEAHELPEHSIVNDLVEQLGVTELIRPRLNEISVYRGSKAIPLQSDDQLYEGDIVDLGPSFPLRRKGKRLRPKPNSEHKSTAEKGKSLIPIGDFDLQSAVDIPAEYAEYAQRQLDLCKHCLPFPDQKSRVVGYVTTNGTITIHRIGCPHIGDPARLFSVAWLPSRASMGTVNLQIDAWNRVGLLEAISHEIACRGIDISKLAVDVLSNDTAHFTISIRNSELVELQDLTQSISAIDYVHRVYPSTPSNAAQTISQTGILNPYSFMPVSEDELFFGRGYERKTMREIAHGQVNNRLVFLHGQQRIGKTSLLKRLKADASGTKPRFVPLYVTMESFEGAGFATWLRERIEREALGISPIMAAFDRDQKTALSPEHGLRATLDRLHEWLQPGNRLVLMIDEFQKINDLPAEQAGAAVDLLLDIHNELRNLVYIFSVSDFHVDSPYYALFQPIKANAIDVRLEELDVDDAEKLISRPIPFLNYGSTMIRQIIHLTKGHPYFIQLLCYDIVRLVDQEGGAFHVKQRHLDEALERLIHDSARFGHLENLIPGGKIVLGCLIRLSAKQRSYVEIETLLHKIKREAAHINGPKAIRDFTNLRVLEKTKDGTKCRIVLPVLEYAIRSRHDWKGTL